MSVIGARLLAALGAIAAVAAVFGCSAPLPTTQLPPTRLVAPALEFPQYRDYRGVVDLRSASGSLDESKIADLARTAQIDFVTIGNLAREGQNNYGIGGFTSDILFIPGATFKTGGGEIVAVNVNDPINTRLAPSALIAAIHDQGGFAIAALPTGFKSQDAYALADGMEVYNQRAELLAVNPQVLWLHAVFFQTDHFLTALNSRLGANLALYDRMADGARVTLLAGMGAPDNLSVAGSKIGRLDQLFLFYTTHLLASERGVDALMDAMRFGRAYVSFDLLGYVEDFAFYAQTGTGNASVKTIMGSEVSLDPTLTLHAEISSPADKIVLYGNGSEVASAENTADFSFAPKTPGAYRIQAYRRGHLWILSNPVYVR